MIELARIIVSLTGSRSSIAFKPAMADDPARRCPDIETATRLLDWRPRISLEHGLARTVSYFEES
jgi:UDP-glucuronate decarboxylase